MCTNGAFAFDSKHPILFNYAIEIVNWIAIDIEGIFNLSLFGERQEQHSYTVMCTTGEEIRDLFVFFFYFLRGDG